MPYQIQQLNDHLIFIVWRRTPAKREAEKFIEELKGILEKAANPLYFLSDLRRGRIITVSVLRELGLLSHHPNLAGSAGFTRDPMSQLFAGTYHKMLTSTAEKNLIFDEPDEALAFLETMAQGITEKINWQQLLTKNLP